MYRIKSVADLHGFDFGGCESVPNSADIQQ